MESGIGAISGVTSEAIRAASGTVRFGFALVQLIIISDKRSRVGCPISCVRVSARKEFHAYDHRQGEAL